MKKRRRGGGASGLNDGETTQQSGSEEVEAMRNGRARYEVALPKEPNAANERHAKAGRMRLSRR
jgi:hypothetical protein